MAGAFAGDGEAVKLARETDREIADVDHLLHFAEALLQDLAGFEGDEAAERLLVGAQLFAEQAHEFAAARRRHVAPGAEGFDAALAILVSMAAASSNATRPISAPSMGE